MPPLRVKAVAAMVRRFQPDGPGDPKEQIERGNAPWKEAETAAADKRLRLRVQAAEWYLRAKPAATGFDKTMIEKRLAELGEANPSPPAARQSIPAGWVRITNRKTGCVIGFRGQGRKANRAGWRLLQDSSSRRRPILCLKTGALKGYARNAPGHWRAVRDAEDRSIFWKFEPLGDGYWRIVNRETG